MADETKIVDPVMDNSTSQPQEQIEETPPSTEDNGVIENKEQEPVIPDPIVEKEERYKQQLQGSKAEALKWKTEYDKLQGSMQEKKDDDIPVSPQDLAVFNALAKKLGYVTKAELEKNTQVQSYAQMQSESLNKFLTEHPEYNKVGDSESDKKWKELQKKLSLYNTSPSDPKQWYTILNKAHKDLNNNTDLAEARGESRGMAKANLAEQAKSGNRASGDVSTPKKKQTPEQQQFSNEVDEQLKKRSWYKG
jgi:hypothetical protein